MNKITDKQLDATEKQFKIFESMIQSMTPKERADPELLAKSSSRRRRIARGSGHKEVDVTNMIGTFSSMRARMRDLSRLMAMSGAQGRVSD